MAIRKIQVGSKRLQFKLRVYFQANPNVLHAFFTIRTTHAMEGNPSDSNTTTCQSQKIILVIIIQLLVQE
jgi:hypothetical protein